MNILLAALSFKNGDLIYNRNQIVSTIKEYNNKVDLILFGESFLQGFDALTWNFEIDKNIALSKDSKIIKEIKNYVKHLKFQFLLAILNYLIQKFLVVKLLLINREKLFLIIVEFLVVGELKKRMIIIKKELPFLHLN